MPYMPPITADFVSNATTASNESVPGMSFPVSAARMYWFRMHVPMTVAATTTGVELAVDVPATPTFIAVNASVPSIAAVGTDNVQTGTVTDDSGPIATDTAVAAGTYGWVEGFCKPSVAGEIQLRIDTDAAAAVTVKAGAFVEFRDLGI